MRECFRDTFARVCKVHPELLNELSAFVTGYLEGLDHTREVSAEFFGLTQELVVLQLSKSSEQASSALPASVETIFVTVLTKLKEYESKETRFSLRSDSTLQGMLSLIAVVVEETKKRSGLKEAVLSLMKAACLLDELFYRCMFYQ